MIKRTCGPIYALAIAPLMVPIAALALMGDRALAAEMPEDFQGIWCTSSDTLKDEWFASGPYTEGTDCERGFVAKHSSVEITATAVKSADLSVSCLVRKVTKFDV